MPSENRGPPTEKLPYDRMPEHVLDKLPDVVAPPDPTVPQTGAFGGFVADYGWEPWAFDGVTAWMLADVNPGTGSSLPSGFTAFNGDLYFSAYAPATGQELHRLDGATGPVSVTDVNPGIDGPYPNQFTPLNGDLYFGAHTVATGRELYRLGGATGAVSAIDVDPGIESSVPEEFTPLNGDLYFGAPCAIRRNGH
jgi:ELWxxDGT repeat protein